MVHGFNDARRRYHHVDAMSKQPIKGNSSDIFVDVEYEKKAAITPGVGFNETTILKLASYVIKWISSVVSILLMPNEFYL